MEILAPAGNLETLKVAIQAGCDAVYISGKDFGARKFANNFTNGEIVEAIAYAHLRNIKVYLTINTIIYDEEWDKLHDYLVFLSENKVDAVIVQDLGVLYYIRKNFPNLIVHASTQMNIHNVDGAKQLMKLGVKRVVLSRETPIDIVKDIIGLGIQVEVFGHGALCYSQSGQCLMSYFIGKRSGNRGECAQPCRKDYKIYENNKLISSSKAFLSMKDLNTIEYIKELEDIGVSSLKIEGRMKSPQYVATVVNSYKSMLSGKKVNNINKKLQLAFNRKFTKGFLFSENNKDVTNIDSVNHQGIKIGKVINVTNNFIVIQSNEIIDSEDALRIKSDNSELGFFVREFEKHNNEYKIKGRFQVDIGDSVYKVVDSNQTLYVQELLNNEKYNIKLEAQIIIKHDLPLELNLKGQNIEVTLKSDTITELAKNPLNIDRIKEQLSKTDSKLIKLCKIDVIYDNVCFVPISSINQIRRDTLNLWINKYLEDYQIEVNEPLELEKTAKKDICIYDKFDFVVHTKEQYDWCKMNGFNNVYSYLDHTYSRHMHFDSCLNNVMVHNLSDYTNNNTLSPSCNIVNKEHLLLLEHFNIDTAYLSNELSLEQILDLSDCHLNYNLGIMVYGRPEVMVSRHCFINKVKNENGINCLNCIENNYVIEDSYDNKMPVYANCYKNVPELTIHHYKKINNFKYIKDIRHTNIMKYLIILTDENIDELENIKRRVRQEGD